MLKFSLIGLVSVALLSGCGGQKYNDAYAYKIEPTTKGQKAKDLLDCSVQAAQAVPTNTKVETTPRYTTPVSCSSYTSYGGYVDTDCTGGQTYGGQTYSYDANATLREKVRLQCMADRGYLTTTNPIPYCEPEQVPAGYITAMTIVHEPKAGACAINGTDQYDGSVILLPEDQLVPNKG